MKFQQEYWNNNGNWNTIYKSNKIDNADLVLCFGNGNKLLDNSFQLELAHSYPDAQILSCTSVEQQDVLEENLMITAISFEQSNFQTYVAQSNNEVLDAFQLGEDIINNLKGKSLDRVLLFSNYEEINISEVVKGIQSNKKGLLITDMITTIITSKEDTDWKAFGPIQTDGFTIDNLMQETKKINKRRQSSAR